MKKPIVLVIMDGVGRGDGVDIAFFNACGLNGTLGKARYDLDMASGRDLGHYAAVYGVQVGLRKYLIGQHVSSVLDHGNGSFITG